MTISEAGQGLPRAIEADDDPIETREWLNSIDAVVRYRGPERALFLLQKLETWLRDQGVSALQPPYSAYRNTIPLEKQCLPRRCRSGGAHHRDHSLECACYGGAGQSGLRRTRGPSSRATPPPRKSSRSASITSSAAGAKAGRGSGFFPTTLRARRLRARLPRRSAERGCSSRAFRQEIGGRGLSLLLSSLAHA